jgi:anthranilate phosphoribosyltransferase
MILFILRRRWILFKNFLDKVISGEHLSRDDARQAMLTIMSGQATEAQIGSFLTALRIKGETSDEITGFAEILRNQAETIDCVGDMLDTCGTGGDQAGTFNVSTTVAFVLAGAGVTVAKHGNRGVSSSCGSADVLMALGVAIDLPPELVAKSIRDINIGFLYAPTFHKAMKYAAGPRRELGFRTVFNLLGPLINPVKANRQIVGVYERSLTQKLAETLLLLGVARAMVVHSLDGLDEISSITPTQVSEVNNGRITSYLIDPLAYGFAVGDRTVYQGGTPAENAAISLKILRGEQGFKRDIVLINAAAGLVVADKVANLADGLVMAADSIDSGAALGKLEALKLFSQSSREGLLLS